MRNAGIVFSVVALCSLLAPVLAHAQFQEPTKDELQMTSDPKAPGAAAVYLYREETTDDQLHFHSMYERVKVLTEKGKELATIRIPYERGNFKVTDIRGRTIHADGTVIPLTAKPEDLVDVKTKGYQVNTMVFTLPSVEVGSIPEYRLQIRYDDGQVSEPTWEIQQPYFVHKAHYFFNPSHTYAENARGELLSRIMYQSHTGNYKIVVDQNGRYTLDVADVPSLPHDDWMPPLNSLRWQTAFYYTQYSSGSEFWQKEGKRWDKETNEFATGKGIQGAVAQIVSSGDSDEQKARKIYDAVMKLENTSFTREKSEAERKKEKIKEIKKVDDVWIQKSGNDNELALLYVAMARAAGLQAWPMKVVDRNEAVFDPTYMTLSQLDDYIAIVKIGPREIFLDPGQKMCPFGLLAWKHTLAGGLRGSDQGPGYTVTPASQYTQTLVQRIADLTVSVDKPLEFHYQLTAGQYAHTAGPLLLVRPRVMGSFVTPFDNKPRTLPIDLSATGRWHDSYDITVPAGYVVDETPDPVDVDLDFASYHSKISTKANQLHYEREYVVRQVEIPADKAADFRKLEGAIMMDERGTAVLKKAAN